MVKIISETVQEFEGERFYLCAFYFQRKGKRLHRAVWEKANGRKVPKGHHVHHKDEDRSNNAPDNLEAILGAEHISQHGQNPTEKQSAARRKNQKAATAGNKAMSKEKRGAATKKAWDNRRKKPPTKKNCEHCGKE